MINPNSSKIILKYSELSQAERHLLKSGKGAGRRSHCILDGKNFASRTAENAHRKKGGGECGAWSHCLPRVLCCLKHRARMLKMNKKENRLLCSNNQNPNPPQKMNGAKNLKRGTIKRASRNYSKSSDLNRSSINN